MRNVPTAALLDKCTECRENTDKLDNWCGFYRLLQKLQEYGLRTFVDHTIGQHIDTDKIVPAYKKLFYMQWIDAVLHDSPLLLEFGRVPHDEAVKLFKEKDALCFNANKAGIKAALSAQRPDLDMIAQGAGSLYCFAKERKSGSKKVYARCFPK